MCFSGYGAIKEELPSCPKVSEKAPLFALSFQISGIAHVFKEENKLPNHPNKGMQWHTNMKNFSAL